MKNTAMPFSEKLRVYRSGCRALANLYLKETPDVGDQFHAGLAASMMKDAFGARTVEDKLRLSESVQRTLIDMGVSR